MATRVLAVIPARLESKRFPRKALHLWKGKPLLYYVWHTVSKVRRIDRLVIATDSPEIKQAATQFGAEVAMTSSRHRTGSDRAAEVLAQLGGDLIVNIQGDCLGVSAATLSSAIAKMQNDRSIACATLARRITSDDELFDPNCVKLVIGPDKHALWFSRYPLPYVRGAGKGNRAQQFPYWYHIGIYFYRRSVLEKFAGWKRSNLEKAESLEQLRLLEHCVRMRVFETKMQTVSIDSPDDLDKMSRFT